MVSVFVMESVSGGQFAFELLDPEAEILDDLSCFISRVLGMSWFRQYTIICVVDSARYPSLVCDLLMFWGRISWSRVLLT